MQKKKQKKMEEKERNKNETAMMIMVVVVRMMVVMMTTTTAMVMITSTKPQCTEVTHTLYGGMAVKVYCTTAMSWSELAGRSMMRGEGKVTSSVVPSYLTTVVLMGIVSPMDSPAFLTASVMSIL